MTTFAVSDVNGRFLSQQGIATPPGPQTASRKFSDKILQMIESHPDLLFEGIGISIPG